MIQLPRRAALLGGLALGVMPSLRRAGAQPRRDVLRYGLSTWPPNLQPWPSTGQAAGMVKMLLHRRLTGFDETGELRGELAREFGLDADGAWVFRLRPEAVFQNGERVTSEDVKWTIEQVAAERSTAYYRTQMQEIARVETPDAHTVRLVMKEPIATVPLWFANYNMPIVWRGSRDPVNAPVGCGPYRLAGQERGSWLELQASPTYWVPGLPRLRTIRMVVYADENLRLAALQSGDMDMIEFVPWTGMAAVENDPRFKLASSVGPFMDILFNGTRPPFDNPLVRRAVAHAVRREDIVRAAFSGRGRILEGMPVVEGTPWFDAELARGHRHDPERSRALLREAGHPNGINTTILSTGTFNMHKDTAEIVQQHLAAIGIRAEMRVVDWSTRVAMGTRGQYDLAVHGVSADFNDPDGLTVVLDTSLSATHGRSFGLRTPRTTDALRRGRAEFDTTKRIEIYREMQRAALEEVPIVGLAWREQGYGLDRRVGGFAALPGALNLSSGAMLEFTGFTA
jgi:peptide/nickel transport system substrate-binding protein